MLIGYGLPAGSLAGWSAEPKLDGWRCQLALDAGLPHGLTVRTRAGRGITEQVPELWPLADLGVSVLLDGELVAGAGRSEDFYGLAPNLARRHRHEQVSFVAFDVLWCQGETVTDQPYWARRRLLDHLVSLADGQLVAVSRFDATDVDGILAICEALGVEGLVVKRDGSVYRPGRSKNWRKVKSPSWRAMHMELRRPR